METAERLATIEANMKNLEKEVTQHAADDREFHTQILTRVDLLKTETSNELKSLASEINKLMLKLAFAGGIIFAVKSYFEFHK